jgi:hypothetical protein
MVRLDGRSDVVVRLRTEVRGSVSAAIDESPAFSCR